MQNPKKFSNWVTPGKLLLLIFLGLLLVGGPVVASSGGSFDLSWWTVDGGGGSSSGDSFALNGTIGQADVSEPLSGGDYTLNGGFWAGVGPGEWSIYLPAVLR